MALKVVPTKGNLISTKKQLQLAVLGYDAALVVADAIKRAGSDDPEKIRQALEETKDLQITVGKISLDKNHNPIKSAVVIEMKNGKQVFKEKINPQEM